MKKEKYNIKDYVGKKYAHLTIMSDVPLSDRIKKYECRCDCGNTVYRHLCHIVTGHTKTCGKCNSFLLDRTDKRKQYLDISGQRFNRLKAIKFVGYDNFSRAKWLFECDCGNKVVASAYNVKSGTTKSCGCLKHFPNRRKDMSGMTVGKLTVTDHSFKKGKFLYWRCKCSCGNIIDVKAANLQRGHTKSCGCLYEEKENNAKKHNEWSYNVKMIYDNECAKCGAKKRLQAHHIFSRNMYPQYEKRYGNGICLCVDCHRDFHKKYGYKCNESDLADFLGISDNAKNIIRLAVERENKDEDLKKVIHYAILALKYDYGYKQEDVERFLKEKFISQEKDSQTYGNPLRG